MGLSITHAIRPAGPLPEFTVSCPFDLHAVAQQGERELLIDGILQVVVLLLRLLCYGRV